MSGIDINPYPRVLNGEGCLFGRHLYERLEEHEKRSDEEVEKLQKKVDRLTWALISAAIGLAATSATLWITHFTP